MADARTSRDSRLSRPRRGRARASARIAATTLQRRFWLRYRLHGDEPALHLPLAVRLAGPVDESSAIAACRDFAAAHPLLTARFDESDDDGSLIPGAASLDVATIDLRGTSAAQAALAALKRRVAVAPFDLERGPLFAVTCARMSDDELVLVADAHHAAFDGASKDIFVNELVERYVAGCEQRALTLDVPPPDAFASWAAGEDSRIGELLAKSSEHWRNVLAEPPGPLLLPGHVRRRFTLPAAARSLVFSIGRDVAERLDSVGAALGASRFELLVAAIRTLLLRYGNERPALGIALDLRSGEARNVVGPLVNELPLVASVPGSATFADAVSSTRAALREIYGFRQAPLPDEHADLQPAVAISYRRTEVAETVLPHGVRVTPQLLIPNYGARAEVELQFRDHGSSLESRLDLRRDAFHPDAARLVAGALKTLLAAALREPEVRLDRLPLESPRERRRAAAMAGGERVTVAAATIPAAFEAQATATPDRIALVAGRPLTYDQLRERAEAVRAGLAARGVRRGDVVGVHLERSADSVAALLGVLAAGAAYLPLDPAYPASRLEFMVRDAGARVVVSRTAAAFADVETLSPDGTAPSRVPPVPLGPADGAAVIYTSGSTGAPKGVLLPHGALLNRLDWGWKAFPFAADETCCHRAPLSFVDSLAELLAPLLAGVRSVVVAAAAGSDPRAFLELVAEFGVTRILVVPTFLRALLERPEADVRLRTVRLVWSSGETLPADLVTDLRRRLPGCAIANVYGSTEVAADVTADAAVAEPPVTVGRPIQNVAVHVLGPGLEPVPAGVPGALAVSGACLAHGYVGRPAATAAAFVPDPFGSPGSRLYRTGDLGRFGPDGRIEHLGRIDDQLKIFGHRIEPAAVEAALCEHADVAEAAVAAQHSPAGEASLVAYVVPRRGSSPDLGRLRRFVAGRLLAAEVPSAVAIVDALPRGPGGKLDRRGLATAPAIEPQAGAYTPPRTPTEELVASAAGDLLGLRRLGRDDDFFDLGGSSLMAARLQARLGDVLGADVPLRALVDARTVAAIAREAERALAAGAASDPGPRSGDRDGDGHALLAPGQERLLFVDELEGPSATYTMSVAFELDGLLDVDALERALRELVSRHESLRTGFVAGVGGPAPFVVGDADVELVRIDVSGLPDAEREERARASAEAAAAFVFDLGRPPLLRATLIRLAIERHHLFLAVHHIVADEWSLSVVNAELGALYRAFAAGAAPSLPALPLQYGDFARWQRARTASGAYERQLAYWRARLLPLPPPLDVPTDLPRPALPTRRGGSLGFEVSRELTQRVREIAREHKATPYTVLATAFHVLLHRYTGRDDVVIGTPLAGRRHVQVEGLVGFFVNTLPLRLSLAGDPTFGDALGRAREAVLELLANQDVPFEAVVEAVNPARTLDRSALFDVVFAYQNVPVERLDLGDVNARRLPLDRHTAKVDLTLSVRERADGGLSATMEYASDLFAARTVRRFAAHYRALLADAAGETGRRVSLLRLTSASERRRLASGTSGPMRSVPFAAAHAAIEARVADAPAAVALEAGRTATTYGELGRAVAGVSGRLAALGLGPETVVASFLDRSPELVVSLLGTLAAGAAYLPVDPALPDERVAFMLADSAAAAVVTTPARAETAARWELPVVVVDEALADDSADVRSSVPHPEQLAYVVYTSGSTGVPKAVSVPHRALANLVASHDRVVALGRTTRLLQFASPGFDASIAEIVITLGNGGVLVFEPREALLPEDRLAQTLRRTRATCAILPPALLAKLDPVGLPDLRAVLAVGEACPAEVAERWGRSVRFVNGYGPTENAVATTLWRYSPRADGRVPIGRPIQNVEVHVLDADLEPVPIGVGGELYLGGNGLARGYAGRAALTAERFVPAPHGPPGQRFYRTGDRGRRLADGELEVLGRLDEQIKIRGQRVEPGEVEAIVRRHPGVEQAAVVAQKGRSGETRLVACIVPAAGAELGVRELRQFLRRQLPEWMLPAGFVVLERLPLTQSGKLDRAALSTVATDEFSRDPGYTDPVSDAESAVARLWAESLGLERVGADDDFFDLGGHSLLATQVVARAEEMIGAPLPLRTIFEASTVRAFARVVSEAASRAPVSA